MINNNIHKGNIAIKIYITKMDKNHNSNCLVNIQRTNKHREMDRK